MTRAKRRLRRLPRKKRIGARRAAQVAIRAGWGKKVAYLVAFAAAVTPGINYATAFALCQWESGGRNIFGHDAGGPFPGLRVTKGRFRRLVEWVRNGGVSNGVGLFQITYGGYLLAHPSLWKPLANAKFGLGLFAGYLRRHGSVERAYAHFNGGTNPPAISFQRGRELQALVKTWEQRLG